VFSAFLLKAKKLTTRLSADNKPTLSYVIPFFNKIIDLFEEPQADITDADFRLGLDDIVASIERFLLQHFLDEEAVDSEQVVSPEDWMSDIDDLTRHYNKNRSPTPTPATSAAQRSSPPHSSPSEGNPLTAIFGAAEPMFATAAATAGSAETAAKLILGAAAKAGYRVLMKHYNNVVSVGVLACALDPRFNLAYYKRVGHGEFITTDYIPLCVFRFCCILFALY
jgi:hypothetical protein